MSHDISHCDGSECPKKEGCYRYTQYLKLVKERGVASFLYPDECISDNFASYWENRADKD